MHEMAYISCFVLFFSVNGLTSLTFLENSRMLPAQGTIFAVSASTEHPILRTIIDFSAKVLQAKTGHAVLYM